MARRKQTDQNERQTVSLSLWITPSQKAELDERAAAAGVRLADMARGALLGYRLHAKDPLREKAVFELSAIGNNLNQLAHRANAIGEIDPHKLNEALQALIDEMKRLHK